MALAAQAFPNEGLDLIFSQLAIYSGGVTTPQTTGLNPYYIGLFTSSSGLGTQVPYGAATLAVVDSATGYTGTYTTNGGGTGTGVTFRELGTASSTAAGYARVSATYSLSSTAAATGATSGTLTALSATATWTLTVSATAGLAVGMNITVTDFLSAQETRVITNIPTGSSIVVLSAALSATCNSGAAWTAGDAVNGQKSTAPAVTFTAQGVWPAVCGYFITNVASGTSGKIVYIANFADTSTPVLNPNDSLTVTPTWLMSN